MYYLYLTNCICEMWALLTKCTFFPWILFCTYQLPLWWPCHVKMRKTIKASRQESFWPLTLHELWLINTSRKHYILQKRLTRGSSGMPKGECGTKKKKSDIKYSHYGVALRLLRAPHKGILALTAVHASQRGYKYMKANMSHFKTFKT